MGQALVRLIAFDRRLQGNVVPEFLMMVEILFAAINGIDLMAKHLFDGLLHTATCADHPEYTGLSHGLIPVSCLPASLQLYDYQASRPSQVARYSQNKKIYSQLQVARSD